MQNANIKKKKKKKTYASSKCNTYIGKIIIHHQYEIKCNY